CRDSCSSSGAGESADDSIAVCAAHGSADRPIAIATRPPAALLNGVDSKLMIHDRHRVAVLAAVLHLAEVAGEIVGEVLVVKMLHGPHAAVLVEHFNRERAARVGRSNLAAGDF